MFQHWRVFGISLMLSLAAAVAPAQPTPWPACSSPAGAARVTINGTVSDATGARITSATVHIGCGSHMQQALTDGSGRFTLTMPEGEYRLQVEAAGFAIYTKDLNVSSHSSNADVTLAVQDASNTVTVQADSGYVASDCTLTTKTDTPLLETPQSISVITRDQMDALAPQSINEALRYAPGIVPESQGTSSSFWNASSLQLRGFIPDIYQDGLTDDEYGNTLLDAYFYQRIEVLEGPSSVLYEQGNPAGIVNVESKRPMVTSLHEVHLKCPTRLLSDPRRNRKKEQSDTARQKVFPLNQCSRPVTWLWTDLGQVSALRVISRTSTTTYRNTKKTLTKIARELSVDAVVEGSVLRDGNEVRVTAQLIDARTDEHLWARSPLLMRSAST